MKDTLFLLEREFADGGEGPFYCPESAFVEGILSYYPQLREQLDVRYVGFTKPRAAIVELLGEANQSCPVLIIANKSARVQYDIPESNGHLFVTGDRAIARYLANRHGIASVHGEEICVVAG